MKQPRRRLPGPDLRGARSQAYALAMAPFLFQAARSAVKLGLAEALRQAGVSGKNAQELADETQIPLTSMDTLLDALRSGELVDCDEGGCWRLTTVGLAWCSDPQIQVEAEFTQKYAGMA